MRKVSRSQIAGLIYDWWTHWLVECQGRNVILEVPVNDHVSLYQYHLQEKVLVRAALLGRRFSGKRTTSLLPSVLRASDAITAVAVQCLAYDEEGRQRWWWRGSSSAIFVYIDFIIIIIILPCFYSFTTCLMECVTTHVCFPSHVYQIAFEIVV